MQQGRVLTWQGRKYYIQARGGELFVEFSAIDLDYENQAEKPNIQAKFVIHKSYDLE